MTIDAAHAPALFPLEILNVDPSPKYSRTLPLGVATRTYGICSSFSSSATYSTTLARFMCQ
jgi:hypothetical protein